MLASQFSASLSATERALPEPRPHIVVGITNAQTCLNLTGRLLALSRAGYRVTLVSSPGELLCQTAAAQGAHASAIPIQRKIAPLSDLVSLARLWRLLVRLRPDLTEFSTPKAGLLGNLAALLAGVPARVYMLRGVKLTRSTGLKRHILLAAERLSAACAHVVLCNSPSLWSEASELRIAPSAKLRLLGNGSTNGVDVRRFSPGPTHVREQFSIPPNSPVIGFVGRLTRDKGVPELLTAFDRILEVQPDACLLLVGWFDAADDALAITLKSRIQSHPRICSTGYVADSAPYYRAMDLLVLPTWREGFPNVVLEAGAAGIPVVTTLSTGSRDSVIHEITGLLIPPGHPEAIVESVLKLLRDPTLRSRMGQAARAWVSSHYSDAHVLGLLVEFYRALMRDHPLRK